MLKQFYNIISNQFVTFFKEEAKNGEVNRYYLSLPNETYIQSIMEAVSELEEAEPFVYEAEGEEAYETVALRFGDYKYVFATTLNGTHLDFIVNLRNEMSEQKGIWKNTSIIMISDKMLDSIRGGSRNLTAEGLPLNASQIVGNIQKLVEESTIPAENKAFLNHYLAGREELKNVENASFLDFEDVLGWIYSEEMDYESIKTLGYYPDKELHTFIEAADLEVEGSAKHKRAQKALKQRLDENAETFEEHARIRELGNAEERFIEEYDDFGKDIYKDEKEIDFSKVLEEKEKVATKKDISFMEEKVQVELITSVGRSKINSFWNTKQGKRAFDLVIFQPIVEEAAEIIVKLPFSVSVAQENINGKHKSKVVKNGKTLIATLPLQHQDISFASFSYRHENMSSSNFTFKLLVIRDEQAYYAALKTAYKLNAKGNFIVKLNNENTLTLGDGSIPYEVSTIDETLEADGTGYTISFTPALLDEETREFEFNISRNGSVLPIQIDDDILRATPITDTKIWEYKMKNEQSFAYLEDGAKVMLHQHPYSTMERHRVFFKWEATWLEQSLYAAVVRNGQLYEKELTLSSKMQQAYMQFLHALRVTESIPSFIYYTEDIRRAAETYIQTFNEEIESISNNALMTAEQRDLLYLGTLEKDFSLYMTPFSPLNVAYQLALANEMNAEEIDSNVLKQLNPAYIIPYLVNDRNEIYKPDSNDSLVEWHEYRPQEQVSIGETNNFLAKVINEKMSQFVNYYEYLFEISAQPTLIMNVINIKNDSEVLKGILRWFKADIQKKGTFTKLLTVDIHYYTDDLDRISSFELFNSLELPKQVKEIFGVDLNTKQLDDFDTLIEIQKRLRFSKCSMDEELTYSHINFYKMNSNESIAKQIVTDAPNSTSLGGLYVSSSSHQTDNGGYRLGFGLGQSDYKRTQLLEFAKNINELSANRTNSGNDPYNKNNVISLHITTDDENRLSELYSSCTWLTFIDPSVDLEYFEKSSSDLVIVHYSDQLSSSNHYDAITVTDKSPQYFRVIEEFLASHGVKVQPEMMTNIIQAFNTFNGEWLLRAVQNRGHDQREKMSIVAAIKHILLRFEQSHIKWVPISMEEIVRVTGNVGLKKADGLFSGKTIGRRGNCSDDLLLIGVEETETIPNVYLLPVEVKIGQNASNVIDKGISQVKELNLRLNEYLNNDSFDAKFLRNFFMRMYIMNAHKMVLNMIWPEKDYNLSEHLKEQLLNDEFTLSDSLRAELGEGAVMSFKKLLVEETEERKSGVMVYEVPEQIAYQSLGVTMEQLKNRDFSSVEQIEKTKQKSLEIVEIDEFISEPESEVSFEESTNVEIEKIIETNEQEVFEESIVAENVQEMVEEDAFLERETSILREEQAVFAAETPVKIEGSRPLLGITTNDEHVYWEFGVQQLANRHLVIGGRSGQGKTYFIQSVLRQLAMQDQPALIVDYSSSYTKTQLDDVFLNTVGDKFHERVVYFDGFPINPFIRRDKTIAGQVNKEPATETASRIKEVFTSVYNFGPQQSNALYRAAKKCIEAYGDKATLTLMMEMLVESEEISSAVAETIANKLALFVDIDPFSYNEEFTWDDYFNEKGQISVIQFEGFEQDSIKKAMTEFILWDLWYFAQSNTAARPLPIILDEAQNLNFKAGSPSDKILREGRKFGMSVWFATQTFSNFRKEELVVLENAATSVFFKPSESELNLVADKLNMKKDIELLRTLKKGECIVQGQFMEAEELTPQTTKIVKVPAME
ncbi:DNA phosphorothioation-dependent restriction protein DptH [Kurthia senegalensis]|uniref:DNA phosphorothioation-dependent restriction protein DptH n=1 Tax=Kurthia senegalensis TaxID=1033740 RepID=UPI00028A0640|nr:DNA phosphorothioation-dependent restriction protein DptH [Kurthia senegalensis]